MSTFPRAFLCRLLAVLLAAAPCAAQTQAAMIASEQAIAASTQHERETVGRFLVRADVQRQLAALGAPNAAERVALLSDDEVRSLAGKIDSLPAGADSGVTFLVIIALILLLLVILDWRK